MKNAIPTAETDLPTAPVERQDAWYELASRRSGQTLVCLYWRPREDDVFVYVRDELTGEDFVLEPPSSAALTAFYHPFAMRRP
jgi:hypothetical protein